MTTIQSESTPPPHDPSPLQEHLKTLKEQKTQTYSQTPWLTPPRQDSKNPSMTMHLGHTTQQSAQLTCWCEQQAPSPPQHPTPPPPSPNQPIPTSFITLQSLPR